VTIVGASVVASTEWQKPAVSECKASFVNFLSLIGIA
jgi:hypothetical protein